MDLHCTAFGRCFFVRAHVGAAHGRDLGVRSWRWLGHAITGKPRHLRCGMQQQSHVVVVGLAAMGRSYRNPVEAVGQATSGVSPLSMARIVGFGSPGPASPALRSAQGVHPRREAMPRKRLGFTHGRAFADSEDADRTRFFEIIAAIHGATSWASVRPARPSMAGRSPTQKMPIGHLLGASAHPIHPSSRSENSSACSSSCARMPSRMRLVVVSLSPM